MKRRRSSLEGDAAGPQTKKRGTNAATSDTTLPFRGVRNDTSAYLPLDPNVNEIRYLALDPGEGDAPLSGFLGYLALQGSQTHTPTISYQAVSYCWGEIKDTLELTLRCAKTKEATAQSSQDAWTAQQYQITRNLDALLRALRKPDQHRILWIDAICIAQNDAVEKTHQVRSMGLVYSLASEVLVWLGEADAYSDITVEAHRILASSVLSVPLVEEFKSLIENVEGLKRYVIEQDFGALWYESAGESRKLLPLMVNLLKPDLPDENPIEYLDGKLKDMCQPHGLWKLFLDCTDRYLSRPWFRRIWVIQEIVMAPMNANGARRVIVFSGQARMQWNDLVALALVLRTTVHKESYPNIDFFNNSWLPLSVRVPESMGPARFSIEDCLFRTATFESTDPRDRLFALFQLGSDTLDMFKLEPLLSPDYTRSFTLVMANYRRWQLSRSTVSSSPEDKNDGGGDTSNSHAPSHDYPVFQDAPRFDLESVLNSPPSTTFGPLDYLLAIDTTRKDLSQQEGPSWLTNTFSLDKNIMDGFAEKYGVYNASGGRPSITRSTTSPFSLLLQGVHIGRIKGVPVPEPLRDETSASLSHYMVIKPGRQPFMVSKRDSDDLSKVYTESLARAKCHTSSLALRSKSRPRGKFKALSYHMEERELRSRSLPFTAGRPLMENRRLYCTTDGDFVLTSEKAKTGDDIVILYGGRVPFVLRKERKGKYSVLAPCFFNQDKWMKGEELASEPVAEEFFELV